MSGPNAHLDGAMIINLERRVDRYYFALGSLKAQRFNVFPDDGRVIRFLAHDALDYETIEQIKKAAVADGFEEFSDFDIPSRSYAAWFWTWRSALRHIIEIDKTMLLLIDDYVLIPGWTFWRLYNLTSEAYGVPDYGLRLIQCSHCYNSKAVTNSQPFSSNLAKGLSGEIDVATILNPAGAKLMLEMASQQPLTTPAGDFGKLAQKLKHPNYAQGVWYTLDDICVHSGVGMGEDSDIT